MNDKILREMFTSLWDSLSKWYPLSVDRINGGFYSNISYDWKLMRAQDKMIVTQSRHIWTASKAASFFNKEEDTNIALHGFKFLKEKMWDKDYGGFYQIRSVKGTFTNSNGFKDEKRMYGNAFAIYGLAALYALTRDGRVLDFIEQAFEWIETHAADTQGKGYFQFLTREGKPFGKEKKTNAADRKEAGYKDQNSSMHLLEAYTELYKVYKNDKLRSRLEKLLFLFQDTIIDDKGYLRLFFDHNWNPVSFRYAPEKTRKENYGLDHVSFGHDFETAYLMLEASYCLGLKDDSETLYTAKKMVDHSIEKGWDNENGGFFDQGYYFRDNSFGIIKHSKIWWVQAEALNTLLLFSKIFLDENHYYAMFVKMWEYIKEYMLDKKYGDWYWGSIEKEPFYRYEPKGTIWKCNYHTGRALMNCIKMLSDESSELYRNNENFRKEKIEFDHFIGHWKQSPYPIRR